jgi:hypothetical protein
MTVLPFLATSGELHERPMGFSIGSASEGRTIQWLAANEVTKRKMFIRLLSRFLTNRNSSNR